MGDTISMNNLSIFSNLIFHHMDLWAWYHSDVFDIQSFIPEFIEVYKVLKVISLDIIAWLQLLMMYCMFASASRAAILFNDL